MAAPVTSARLGDAHRLSKGMGPGLNANSWTYSHLSVLLSDGLGRPDVLQWLQGQNEGDALKHLTRRLAQN